MITDKIQAYLNSKNTTFNAELAREVGELAEYSFKRQFMEEKEDRAGVLRLSAAGKCPRQQAYAYHGFPPNGKEIDARAKVVFFQGDLVELMIMPLAKMAGCDISETGQSQRTVSLKIGDVEIFGHPDGFLTHKGKKYLLECKSMSSFAYERFDKGEVDDSYAIQMNEYMEASGLNECVLVAVNKDSGVMGEIVIPKQQFLVDRGIINLQSALGSSKDNLPIQPSEYGPDAKGLYTWNCLYCTFYGHCRPNAEKVLVGRSYKLKEKK